MHINATEYKYNYQYKTKYINTFFKSKLQDILAQSCYNNDNIY